MEQREIRGYAKEEVRVTLLAYVPAVWDTYYRAALVDNLAHIMQVHFDNKEFLLSEFF